MKSYLKRTAGSLFKEPVLFCLALVWVFSWQGPVRAEALDQKPGADGAAIAAAAENAYRENRFSDAVRLYSLAAERSPRESSIFFGRAMAYEMVNQVQKAAQDYRTSMESDPGNFRAMENLAGIYERQGESIPEAIRLYKRALDLDPRPVWKEHLAFCIAILGNRLQLRDPSAVACWNTGNESATKGAVEEAEVLYSRAIELDPRMFQGYFSRGLLRMKKLEFAAAVKDFDAACRLCPSLRGCFVRRGMAHEQMGNPDKALDDLERATRVDPRDSEAHYQLGRLLERRNELARAFASYLAALRLRPKGELRNQVEGRAAALQGTARAASKSGAEGQLRDKTLW